MTTPVLSVEHISRVFRSRKGLISSFSGVKQVDKKAVDNISFHIDPGEVFGLMGESGSGKTTVARIVARLILPTAGVVRFKGRSIDEYSNHELRTTYRKRVRVVFQHPEAVLNPGLKVGRVLDRLLSLHTTLDRQERDERSRFLLERVRLSARHLDMYPHQLSGGEKKRISLCMGFATDPDLIIADEPFVGLDVSLQAELLDIVQDIQKEKKFSMLLITHNVAMGRCICDRLGIMEAGRMVDVATRDEFDRGQLTAPYARRLHEAYKTSIAKLQHAMLKSP